MARLFASAILLLVLVHSGYSQQASVNQVRISTPQGPQVDAWHAAGASLLIPGWGQQLQGNRSGAQLFYLSELTFWVATLSSYSAKEHYLTTALDYVGRHAGATSAPRDEDFLQLMGEYQSRSGTSGNNASPDIGEDYNQDLLRAGLAVDSRYPNTEPYSWDWGSSDIQANQDRQDRYNSLLRRYRLSKIIFQTSVGLLILNRVVSSIHALRSGQSSSISTTSQSQFWFDPTNQEFNVSWRKAF